MVWSQWYDDKSWTFSIYIGFGKGDHVDNFVIVIPENNVKILGLHLDKTKYFIEYVSKLYSKAGKQVQVLFRLNRVLNESFVTNRQVVR